MEILNVLEKSATAIASILHTTLDLHQEQILSDSVDVSAVLQEQVVLDKGGQSKFRHHLVDSALQKVPEFATSQVLQGAGRYGQREDGIIELFMLLVG